MLTIYIVQNFEEKIYASRNANPPLGRSIAVYNYPLMHNHFSSCNYQYITQKRVHAYLRVCGCYPSQGATRRVPGYLTGWRRQVM